MGCTRAQKTAAMDGNQVAPLPMVGETGREQILGGLRVEGNCWQLKSRDLLLEKMDLGQNCLEGARAD